MATTHRWQLASSHHQCSSDWDKKNVQNIHHCSTTLRQTKTKTSSISFAKIELNSSSLCINYYWHEADCLVEVYQRCSQKPALSSARLEIENYTDDPQKCLPNILKEINDYSSSNSTYHFDTRHDFLHINKVWVYELDVLKGDHSSIMLGQEIFCTVDVR